MIKERYKHLFDHIHSSDALVERTLATARQPVRTRFSMPRLMKLVPVAAFILMLTIATPALAANSTAFNELLYRFAPAAAMHFRPVNLSCEDSGVTVELMAVNINGDTAEMYIAVQGEMIDGTVDLFDSYQLDTAKDSEATCHQTGYIEETNTAVFYINYRHMDGSPIDGQKLTFSLHRMLSGKQEHTCDLTSFLPQSKEESATFRPAEINGFGGDAVDNRAAYTNVLIPADAPIPIVDGVSFSGSGYVDGKLRIQIRYEDNLRTDNHGFLRFVSADNQAIHEFASIHFWDGKDAIVEYVFSPDTIPEEPVLMGDFTTCDTLITGDWAITFPLVEYGS